MKIPENNITCLGCSQPIQGPTVINRMPNGTSCKSCVDRVLDAQPSLLINEDAAAEAQAEQKMAPILHFPTPARADWDDAPEPA